MVCKHCKAENEDEALFCSSCGKPLEDEEHERTQMRVTRLRRRAMLQRIISVPRFGNRRMQSQSCSLRLIF